jgi:hypothetical protein
VIEVLPAQLLTFERIGRGEGMTVMNAKRQTTRFPGVVFRPFEEGAPLAIQLALVWKRDDLDALAKRFAASARRVLGLQRPARVAR